jgi:outer membrane protein TolC
VANLERLPIPSLILGREWDDRPFSPASGAIFGLSFPFPIWNIGSANASAARARARAAAARAAEQRLEVTELLARTTVRLSTTRARALFLRDSLLPRAQRLRAGVARLYRAGDTSVLPLFDALRSERDVAVSYSRTLFEYQQALADWLALRGRIE